MAKKPKIKTPKWILEGYDSEEEYNKDKGIENKKEKGKTFKIRECPKCNSDNVKLVVGDSSKGPRKWECNECGWKGVEIIKKELTEDELMKYMDEKGEEVA